MGHPCEVSTPAICWFYGKKKIKLIGTKYISIFQCIINWLPYELFLHFGWHWNWAVKSVTVFVFLFILFGTTLAPFSEIDLLMFRRPLLPALFKLWDTGICLKWLLPNLFLNYCWNGRVLPSLYDVAQIHHQAVFHIFQQKYFIEHWCISM